MESIRSIRDEELDRLKPLWLALQGHHMRISPRLADLPKRLPEESWSRRRAKYARWLESQETLGLVSERGLV
ncbi:MAG: GNAT family N-acetyltransferase, partial [Solirubrobacteraceae bacterium]